MIQSKIWLYVTFGVFAACIFLVRRLYQAKRDPREPRIVPSFIPIPFVGHLLGLYWYRTNYYTKLSAHYGLPIVTMSMFGGKVYVIGSPELMHSLHRHPKTVSFWFVEAHFTSKLGNMSKSSAKELVANLEPGSEKDKADFVEGLHLIRQAMSPQGGMDDMSRVAAKVIKGQLDTLQARQARHRVDLWNWIQHDITLATTEAVYGPGNPYRDPKVAQGFWDFAEDTIGILVSSLLPRELPSAGIRGREVVVGAMKHYFTSKAYLQGSGVVRSRYTTVAHDESEDDMARSETVNGIAILANSVPTAFWTIFHIFSDPALLATVRKQVEQITTTSSDERIKSINLRRLKDGHASIIFSVIQETLRHRATGIGPRMIMEDIRVGADGYLLKKGSFVIIANKALHFSGAEWGSTVSEFSADRFTSKTPGHAFRGFGGGANLCPGRNFAMFEVGALVAMLVSRFDVEPVGTGGWCDPGQNVTNMSLQIAPPSSKVVVDLVERSDSQDWIWDFEI